MLMYEVVLYNISIKCFSKKSQETCLSMCPWGQDLHRMRTLFAILCLLRRSNVPCAPNACLPMWFTFLYHMQGLSNRSMHLHEIPDHTGRLIFSSNGWMAFVQSTKAHSWTGRGGEQHLSVSGVLLSMLRLHLLCFCLDSPDVGWLCLYSSTDLTGPYASRPVANPCHGTGGSLMARNPERSGFPECRQGPSQMDDTDPKSLVQARPAGGREELHQVARLSLAPPFTVTTSGTTQFRSQPPLPQVSSPEAQL